MELQWFHYYQGKKKYKVLLQCFSLSQETWQQQTLISKLRFLHPAHRIHNGLQNGPKMLCGIAVDVGDWTSLQVGDLLGFVKPSFVWSGLTTPTDPNNVMWFLMRDFLSLSRSAHGLSLRKSPIKNHETLFGLGRVVKLDQTKLGSTKPNKSPIWRLVQSPTSTAILQNTIPYPCNSSSCPQARRPIKAAHSFKFSIVTPLVNMSVRFLNPQIFLSIISLSSTR